MSWSEHPLPPVGSGEPWKVIKQGGGGLVRETEGWESCKRTRVINTGPSEEGRQGRWGEGEGRPERHPLVEWADLARKQVWG